MTVDLATVVVVLAGAISAVSLLIRYARRRSAIMVGGRELVGAFPGGTVECATTYHRRRYVLLRYHVPVNADNSCEVEVLLTSLQAAQLARLLRIAGNA